ncbi:MAG: sulfate permease [Pyrinomonadaceae bacterium]
MSLKPANALKSAFPFLGRFANYDISAFSKDFVAGLTVAVVLIPQVMAYANLAGLPPVMGLYAAFLGAAVAALWGSDRLLSTGPVALVSFVVFSALVPLASPGSPEFIALAIILALFVGLIQLAMGIFHFGFIINFISHSVIAGFTLAAALIIASTQLPNLFGFETTRHEMVLMDLYEIFTSLPNTHAPTLFIGITAVAFITLTKRKIGKSFPAGLIVMIVSIFVSWLFDFERLGVAVVGKINAALAVPSIPDLSFKQVTAILPAAMVIAVIGFLEAYSVSSLINSKTGVKPDENQELIGQGLGNVVSSIFGGYPIAGSFSRTAVNFGAGAMTEVSSLFVSFFVLLTILYFTPLLYFLPKATLGAIVIAALVDLVEFSKFSETFKLSGTDGIVISTTFLFAFITQPDYALFVGIVVSLILFLRKTIAARVVHQVFVFEEERFRTMTADNCQREFENVLILRIEMSVFFANANSIVEQMEDLIYEKGTQLESLVINFSGVNYFDVSACEVLDELLEEVTARGIKVYSMYRKEHVTEIMIKAGLEDKITRLKDIKGFKREFIVQKNINFDLESAIGNEI